MAEYAGDAPEAQNDLHPVRLRRMRRGGQPHGALGAETLAELHVEPEDDAVARQWAAATFLRRDTAFSAAVP